VFWGVDFQTATISSFILLQQVKSRFIEVITTNISDFCLCGVVVGLCEEDLLILSILVEIC